MSKYVFCSLGAFWVTFDPTSWSFLWWWWLAIRGGKNLGGRGLRRSVRSGGWGRRGAGRGRGRERWRVWRGGGGVVSFCCLWLFCWVAAELWVGRRGRGWMQIKEERERERVQYSCHVLRHLHWNMPSPHCTPCMWNAMKMLWWMRERERERERGQRCWDAST